jgi:NAD-dependent SIR2 family protein deacetylase
MMRNSKFRVVMSGAGVSTGHLSDYASRAAGSIIRKAETSGNRRDLPPTMNHRVVASLFKSGKLDYLLDQNHDNLFLKAGVDYSKVCAIHGSWGDRWNRVLMMDDKLRPDLLEMMMMWSEKADFCFAIGTSLAGMTADVVAEQVARRHKDGPSAGEPSQDRGQGLCILTIQETRMDRAAALKIYARIEDVMEKLQTKLKLKVDTKTYDLPHFTPPKRVVPVAKK